MTKLDLTRPLFVGSVPARFRFVASGADWSAVVVVDRGAAGEGIFSMTGQPVDGVGHDLTNAKPLAGP